jgi:hypothetical protein
MTYPSAPNSQAASWAAQVEDVIAGRSAAALQLGTTSVDSALSRQLSANGINDPATVTALNSATAPSFATLSECAQQMADVLLQLRADTSSAMSNADWSNSFRTRKVVDARNKAQQALDGIQASAIKAAAKIRSQLDAILNPAPSGDPTVAELQIMQAWKLAEPFVDVGGIGDDSLRALANQNVPGMFPALRRYLPLTLMAQQQGRPAEHITTMLEALQQQLDQLELPTLAAAAKRARALSAQLQVALGRLQTGYLQACQEIAGQQRQSVLAGPDGAVPVVDRQLR